MSHLFLPVPAPTADGLEIRCGYLYEKDGQRVYCLGREGELIHQEAAERVSLPHLHFEVHP